jgi:hypothetical protein
MSQLADIDLTPVAEWMRRTNMAFPDANGTEYA